MNRITISRDIADRYKLFNRIDKYKIFSPNGLKNATGFPQVLKEIKLEDIEAYSDVSSSDVSSLKYSTTKYTPTGVYDFYVERDKLVCIAHYNEDNREIPKKISRKAFSLNREIAITAQMGLEESNYSLNTFELEAYVTSHIKSYVEPARVRKIIEAFV